MTSIWLISWILYWHNKDVHSFLCLLWSSFRNNCYVYPLEHHHLHHSHSHIRCNCDSTTTYNEQATTTTRQSTHSPCPLFNNSTSRFKKRQQEKSQLERYLCSWKTMAILFLMTTVCFLSSTVYLSMMRYYHPTFRETNLTQSKNRYENIFYGLLFFSLTLQLWSENFLLGKTTRFIRIGDKFKESIDAQSSTQLQFYIERSISIQFNFTANRRANFGKQTSDPTVFHFWSVQDCFFLLPVCLFIFAKQEQTETSLW